MGIPPEGFDRYRKEADRRYWRHFGLPIVFVVGKPASGKATVCNSICSRYDVSYVSVGQLIRDEASTSTRRGRDLARYVFCEPPKTVPLAKVMDLLNETLGKLIYEYKPVLIQGFPRDYNQASEIEKEGLPIKHMLYLNVLDENARTRTAWKHRYCEVAPLKPEHVERRIALFKEKTIPLIELLSNECRVVELSADENLEEACRTAVSQFGKWLDHSKEGAVFKQDPRRLSGQPSAMHAIEYQAKPSRTSKFVKLIERKPVQPKIILDPKLRNYGLSTTRVWR